MVNGEQVEEQQFKDFLVFLYPVRSKPLPQTRKFIHSYGGKIREGNGGTGEGIWEDEEIVE